MENSTILLSDLKFMLRLPGQARIDIFYTGKGFFAAGVWHQIKETKKSFLGVLLKNETHPFCDSEIDNLILNLHHEFKDFNNLKIENIYSNVGAIKDEKLLN